MVERVSGCGGSFIVSGFRPLPLAETSLYAGMAPRPKDRNAGLFPLTPGFIKEVDFGREQITCAEKVGTIATRFSDAMFGTFRSDWIGNIRVGKDLDPGCCTVFTHGRVKLAYFVPLSRVKTRKTHLFSISVRHNDFGDIVIGHGLYEHAKGANNLFFRYGIHHRGIVSSDDHVVFPLDVNFRGAGYGSESLILLMAAGLRGGMFADYIRNFQFKIYPKDDYDADKRLNQEIQNTLGFLEHAGFDEKGCFDMGRRERRDGVH
ncbi:MAG: hypothetical protein WC527_05660 [Candidatus Margulisiibacteriota bacterium]